MTWNLHPEIALFRLMTNQGYWRRGLRLLRRRDPQGGSAQKPSTFGGHFLFFVSLSEASFSGSLK
jgi:hypothetical protein